MNALREEAPPGAMSIMGDLEIVTVAEHRGLGEQARAALRSSWPEFIFHDPIDSEYIGYAETHFSQYEVLLLEDWEVVARGWGVPLRWDGTIGALPKGYDGALISAMDSHEDSGATDTLCVMGAAVRGDRRGAGLSRKVLTALRERASAAGLIRVIAPVRPTLKSRYPLTPMQSFALWTRSDGLHIDPWIRTHQRLGASILGPAQNSMTIIGTVPEWEGWTNMAFPETGQYAVPDALDLVSIDLERDCGTYNETNLWMRHL